MTLAALGNIDFTGAKVYATNSLNIAAAGTISANAVRDTYAIATCWATWPAKSACPSRAAKAQRP